MTTTADTRYPHLEREAAGAPITSLNLEFLLDQPTLRRRVTELKIRPGIVDEASIELFCYGWCWMLAGAIREQTCWPFGVVEIFDHPDHKGHSTQAHVGIIAPSGEFLDILGPRPGADAVAQYGTGRVLTMTMEDAVATGAQPGGGWKSHAFHPLVVETLQYFAATLIAKAS